jgi:hypothetical protein
MAVTQQEIENRLWDAADELRVAMPEAQYSSSGPTAGSAATAPTPPSGVTAHAVGDTFAAAHLPAPHPRDNSGNCQSLGCSHLVTTDAVSVYQWPDVAGARKHAQTVGDQGFQAGTIVLSYAAARTPAKDRPKYEAALRKALG